MGRGKFKRKPTGRRQFSTSRKMCAGISSLRPPTFKQQEAEVKEEEEESEEEEDEDHQKRKCTQGFIVKPKNVKGKDVDIENTTELSRCERKEIEKQMALEEYTRLRELGKTEQARKDLECLALIHQQRDEAAKKREEETLIRQQRAEEAKKQEKEKAAKGQKKAEASK